MLEGRCLLLQVLLVVYKMLYMCDVNIWIMEKLQRYFSDESSASLTRHFVINYSSIYYWVS